MPRKSIHISSLSHLTPIPAGTRVGPLVTCSVVSPFDPGTRNCPQSTDLQIENLFTHVGNILSEADAGWGDVARMTFYVAAGHDVFASLNGVWIKHFPDESSRPSRYSMTVPDDGSGISVCCDFIAYIDR